MKHHDTPAPAAAPAGGRQAWRHLYALPLDMRKREARIRQLETLYRQALAQEAQAAAAACPAVPVLSARLARQRAALEQAQRDCWQQYQQAAAAIERCPDPLLRAVLHGRCLEGKSYPALAGELARAGIPATADALRKAVDRWLADPDGPENKNMDNL